MKSDRKEFLRKAGFGAITLASLPALGNALAMPAGAAAEEERVFYFVSFSKAMVSGADYRFALEGAGGFSPSRGSARGWGTYVYVNFSAPGPTKPLLAFGRWMPFWDLGLGVLWTGLAPDIPEQSTQFNFVLESGPGLQYFATERIALTMGVRFHHISNATIGDRNLGLNSTLGYMGISFFLPRS